MAEAIMRSKLKAKGIEDAVRVGSCGTGGHFSGSPPDPRTVATLKRHGIKVEEQTARTLCDDDFSSGKWTHILCMDASNLEDALNAYRACDGARDDLAIDTLCAHTKTSDGKDVPDPFYGRGNEGFELVFRACDRACTALVEELALLVRTSVKRKKEEKEKEDEAEEENKKAK